VRAAWRRFSASTGKRVKIPSIFARVPRGSTKPPISRFSFTLRLGKTFASCGTNAIPSALISRGARPVMSRPSSRTAPRLGRRMPATTLRSVDLPAPFGPMMPTISPRSTERSTPLRISSAAVYPATMPPASRRLTA